MQQKSIFKKQHLHEACNNADIDFHTIQPIKPRHLYSNSPYWSPYISLSSNWENLLRHQDNPSLVIIFPILMTFMCYDEEKFDADHYWGLKG